MGTTPLVALTGVTLKALPLQAEPVIEVIDEFGLTVTVIVKLFPVQLPDTGVTVYVAVCAELVGFISVPVILEAAVELPVPPVMPPVTTGALQV